MDSIDTLPFDLYNDRIIAETDTSTFLSLNHKLFGRYKFTGDAAMSGKLYSHG